MSFKRLTRWAGLLLATTVLTLASVLLVLYVPPMQRQVVQWAAARISQHTGMEVKVRELHLTFPLRIEVKGLRVGTLAHVGEMSTHISLRPLWQGVIEADHVAARDISFGTEASLIAIQHVRAEGLTYDWHTRHAHLQRLTLADGNVLWHGKSTPTTDAPRPQRLPLSLSLSSARLMRIGVAYNSTQMQLQSTAGLLTLEALEADTALHLSLLHLAIEEGECMLFSSRLAAHCTQLCMLADSLHYTPTSIRGQLSQLTFKESRGMDLQAATASFAWHEGALSLPSLALRTAHSSLQGHLYLTHYGTDSTSIDSEAHIRIGPTDALLLAQWQASLPKEFASLYPTETLSASLTVAGSMKRLQVKQCRITLPTAFDIGLNGMVQGIATPRQCVAQCHLEASARDLAFLAPLTGSAVLHLPTPMTCQGDLSYAPDTLHAQCLLALEEGTLAIETGYRPMSKTYALHVLTDSFNVQQILPDVKLGAVTLRARLEGEGPDGHLQAQATCADSLMQWHMSTSIRYAPHAIRARIDAQIDDLDLRSLRLADTDIRPALQCHTMLAIDSSSRYSLHSHFSHIALRTGTQSLRPQPLDLRATLTADTARLAVTSGDLSLTASAHIEGFPWQWPSPTEMPRHIAHPQASLRAGSDNPVSDYLSLMGVSYRSIHATMADHTGLLTAHLAVHDISAKGFETDTLALHAHLAHGTLQARLQSSALSWRTPQMQLHGRVRGTFTWDDTFAPDNISGMLHLTDMHYTLPAYNLALHTTDTLAIPLHRGTLAFTSLPLYAAGRHPLRLDGTIAFLGHSPTARLRLTAHDTDLLSPHSSRDAQLSGRAVVSGTVALDGPFDALSITGGLQVRPGSSLHYTYKDAILTAGNQLEGVVTFVSFDADTTALPRVQPPNQLRMSLTLAIDPTVQLAVSLGAGMQNSVALQGGGLLSLQYAPLTGLRLSGRYTIEQGELSINVPLLHVSHMTLRTGSTISWEGNPLNPLLNITAEDRIRASVTLDGSPQSVLFVAGLSLTETMEKLSVQFTLSAPENASMQNLLATLSSEERGKLSVALLTTGLYLGEGGTGNLMNTALMGILQAQLDDISRDAFRTVDVSVGIEPLPDGVNGVSTRTDYTFSIAKRLWNNRIRIIIGGSVTTSNERIEEDGVIDNISIEWRISPVGNQYLRFFYDKNFENILEGEIRETGVGYAYKVTIAK